MGEHATEVLGEGEVVMIHDMLGVDGDVVGIIVSEDGEKCSVKYFDPQSAQVETKNGVDKTKISIDHFSEKRFDRDGTPRTKEEFIHHFGLHDWDNALRTSASYP